MSSGDGATREALGRVVRDTWVAWARAQSDPKPSWLVGWDDLDADQREVDMRIGEAVAAATADAALAPRDTDEILTGEPTDLPLGITRLRRALEAVVSARHGGVGR